MVLKIVKLRFYQILVVHKQLLVQQEKVLGVMLIHVQEIVVLLQLIVVFLQ